MNHKNENIKTKENIFVFYLKILTCVFIMYTAIIIEPRKHAALKFVLKNALECLSDSWDIVFFHGILNAEFAAELVASFPEHERRRIQTVNLKLENLNQKSYSELLATRSCIYDYIHTEYFLVFQTDSMFFKEYKALLSAFLYEKYDYVGAPWSICNYAPTRQRGFIGNGGLSLRRTEKMLEIIRNHNWNHMALTEFEWMEDLFFTNCYSDVTIQKPTYELAKLFSVDEVFSAVSFGCHRPWCHAHYGELVNLHPEVETLKSLQHTL